MASRRPRPHRPAVAEANATLQGPPEGNAIQRSLHGINDWTFAAALGREPVERLVFFVVLGLLIFSRWIAYPSTIWDQDEANFALGVLRFDPLHNQPHAPFFPLWVGFGKVVKTVFPSLAAADCLRLVSVASSVWIFLPLTALWRRILSPFEAIAAAALYLFLPAPWLLSGRAYTEPTATALFVSGAAIWLHSKPTRQMLVTGGVVLSAAILVRPQWAPLALPLGLWVLWRSKDLASRLSVVVPPLLMGLGAAAILVSTAGGLQPLFDAVEQHRKYMAAASAGFSWTYPEFAVFAAVGGTLAGTVWLLLTITGALTMLRKREERPFSWAVAGLLLLPHVGLLVFGENPTLVRYALPVLALSSGLAVYGARSMIRKPGVVLVVGAAAVWSWIVVLPDLERYRQPSPVVAAVEHIEAGPQSGVVAWDRKLVSFVILHRESGSLNRPGVWDYQVELGMFNRRFSKDQSAVFCGEEKRWADEVESRVEFRCRNSLLRRIASPRFLDISVVDGCAFVRPAEPTITIDHMKGGALIPPS